MMIFIANLVLFCLGALINVLVWFAEGPGSSDPKEIDKRDIILSSTVAGIGAVGSLVGLDSLLGMIFNLS